MRTMLLSFKADVYKRVLSGEKIYEHRRVFPNETVKAYLYVSAPVKVMIESWKEKFSYDKAAVERIDNYLKMHTVAMEITNFQNTNMIPLEQLRNDLPGFVVPQMYYYIEDSLLLEYLENNLKPEGDLIKHSFENITSDMICTH